MNGSNTHPPIDVLLTRETLHYVAPPALSMGGGEAVFIGRTRPEVHESHGALRMLRYTAYESMARRVLIALAQKAVDDYGAVFVRIHHSIGEVPIGQPSVVIQVVTGHRAEAFDACRMLIDALKHEAPIWKNEVWADGVSWSRGQEVAPEAFARE